MDWVFDNIQVLLAVAGVIAYWINQLRKKSADEQAPPPPEPTFEDPKLAERTRRIREEIQRKIQQRARGEASAPAPVAREEPPHYEEREEYEAPPVLVSTPVSRVEARRQAEILEEQMTLQERLREAEAMRAASRRRTEFEQATADLGKEARAAARASLLRDLRDPAELRRAFILKEVLGPPVSLR